MERLVLEGDTLGKKHEHYNKLMRIAIAGDQRPAPDKLSKDDNDVENMLKVDIANNNRDVDYILEALKSEDMLYVSRAIKRCTWLITDSQYTHIINPQYLYTQLFPQMTSKATHKLLLQIRLKLKDETRVGQFYDYYKDKNFATAVKWLPNCSLTLIHKEIEIQKERIGLPIFKRLCEKSITVFEKYIPRCDCYKREALKATMFLINFHAEKYLDVIEKVLPYEIPNFNANATGILMKKCPQRLINSFEKFCNRLHLETFAKHLQTDDIKPFLLKYIGKDTMRSWFRFDNLKHFIRYMPVEGKFDFLKKVFIDKDVNLTSSKTSYYENDLCCAMRSCGMPNDGNASSSANIYSWYKFAPFEVAFPDLKKLIRTESSPNERNSMLTVLLLSAKSNVQDVHTVLQYYNEKHINEAFKFKIQFVNVLLSHTNTHKFDDKTWNLLNSLFCSMEVYAESENNVQFCIQSIIVYKVLHFEKVPEIIEKKFEFSTLKKIRSKLNHEEQETVFVYLYNLLFAKMKTKNINVETGLSEIVQILGDVMNLLIDWNKEFNEFPQIHNKIKQIIDIKKKNSFKLELSSLYNKRKSWRKHMINDSLAMSPSQAACINALKHSPELLASCRDDIMSMQSNDKLSLDLLFRKMRIYWPDSLANEWAASFTEKIDQKTAHKAFVRSLCILLPQSQLIDILEKYKPTDKKIRWSEDEELVLGVRKQFAKNMYRSRPLVPLEIVLSYSCGDYLQYGLPSLDAVLHNTSSVGCRLHISRFLGAPVSLQKHGIRLAITKLTFEEIKKTFTDIWNSTNNSSIRAVLFKQTYDLLCKENNDSVITELWQLINMFIENLSKDENKIIYNTLGNIDKVPLSVRSEFCMKGYKYLKSLPSKADVDGVISNMTSNMNKIMESLDPDFVASILLDDLEKKFTTARYYEWERLMSAYLIHTRDENCQNKRFVKVLRPLLTLCIEKWTFKSDGTYHIRQNLDCLLSDICKTFWEYGLDKGMVYPIGMFTDILTVLEKDLPVENNYILLKKWHFIVEYIKLLEEQKSQIESIRSGLSEEQKIRREGNNYYSSDSDNTWNEVYIKVAPAFAAICAEILQKDIKCYSHFIHRLFAKALKNAFSDMQFNPITTLDTLNAIYCGGKKFTELQLVVLKVIPSYNYFDDSKSKWLELRKLISSDPSQEIQMHYHLKFDSYVDDLSKD